MEKQYTLSSKQLRTMGQMLVVQTCEVFGVNTEMSYSRAAAEYGQFFRDMVRSGRLTPVRTGKGKNGTNWYSISDILALRAEEEAKARLI